MAAKFVIVLALAAAASAGLVPVAKVAYAEPEAPAHYEFQYSVQDGHTGDVKQQQEARAGDAVHGSYSLVQPDGVQRIVDYTADALHGFNAAVRYEGHPVAAPASAKLAYAAPVARVAFAAPVSYAAPVARVAYSAPVAYAAPVAKVAYAAPLAQFVIVLALAAAASAGLVPVAKVAYAEPEAPAHYEFQYSVQDGHTGDVKQQQEARAGDAVHGSYSLVQPDGVQRIVDYTADALHGFNAAVRYEGHPVAAPAPAKLAYAAPVARVAYAAPVAKVAYAAPVSYAAPVARVAYSAPVAYAAPVAKVAYSAPLAQVSYSSPVVSYHH
ncbi:cuticle protein 18.6-like [Bicyclus anynana]|uniref:Cuticle protein 18.6-like n=1 Tax=Bicyclus anynana TaxID=110368 RepID=A0ABM3LTU8_BICAN|nr:cuticle protein 18.6-like [Bicyclus anynana]